MELRINDDAEARRILGNAVQPDGSLYNLGRYISWGVDRQAIVLDDSFDVWELEAIVYWMRTYGENAG